MLTNDNNYRIVVQLLFRLLHKTKYKYSFRKYAHKRVIKQPFTTWYLGGTRLYTLRTSTYCKEGELSGGYTPKGFFFNTALVGEFWYNCLLSQREAKSYYQTTVAHNFIHFFNTTIT